LLYELQEKFMEGFQKVSDAIGPVYRRLTAQGGDGGSAYLDLEECCIGENNKNW
jgi:chromosome segregation ATPase